MGYQKELQLDYPLSAPSGHCDICALHHVATCLGLGLKIGGIKLTNRLPQTTVESR